MSIAIAYFLWRAFEDRFGVVHDGTSKEIIQYAAKLSASTDCPHVKEKIATILTGRSVNH